MFPSNNHLHFPLANSTLDLYAHDSSHRKKRVKSDEVIVLSTAPEDSPTHWQQTMLYFYEPIEVKQDQHGRFFNIISEQGEPEIFTHSP
ncbi:putative protein arginine N-methyltransferase 6.2 [Cocos nucifera]|uniref:Protein arginine N-methyltransferase domain-containing protein n=1 Tax=Cocos nucifera TaxID=13894 RepID=A0A8K0IIH4_COCNU|nr:putative protein arginine N-methyltransferase 6.2 [Cocos nucifera]